MRPTPPTLVVREWSRSTPEDTALLRGLQLTEADRDLLAGLARHASLRVEEWRQGLFVEVGPHIGAVTLSCLRLVMLPKLRLDTLMAMVAYAFILDDLTVLDSTGYHVPAAQGLADLLGLALLRNVQRLVRGGPLPRYAEREADLSCPRGRIDMRAAATRPKYPALSCRFTELTTDHLLNQVLAAGLKLAAGIIQSAALRGDLIRAAERYFGEIHQPRLDGAVLAAARSALDRRSRHYAPALKLVALLFQGSRLGDHTTEGEMPLAGFLLDMNRVFECFVDRYLREHAPAGIQVASQDTRADVFTYLENPRGWKQPTLRPDLVFSGPGGETLAVGDAKYRNHHEQPPSTAELYQLTTYGLAYPMREPREVLLFYPLAAQQSEHSTQLLFVPPGAGQVRIRLVGVPLDRILQGVAWQPLNYLVQ